VADRREGAAAGASGGATETTNPVNSAGDGREGLANLEAAVHAAGRRLAELRDTNQQLTRRVRELEAQLAGGAPAVAAGNGAAEAERQEIRRRVEALARHLDRLAAAAG